MLTTAGLLMMSALSLRLAPTADQLAAPDGVLTLGDRVVVITDDRSIRGHVTDLTDDALVLIEDGARLQVPLAGIQRIDRLGDRLLNGVAVGAAIGGASTLGLMAHLCKNCSDVSASLDPRMTLLGTLMGMGVGAIVDAVIVGRTNVFKASAGRKSPVLSADAARPLQGTEKRNTAIAFGRAGWARLTDDEGSLGGGGSSGAGAIVPIGRRVAVQVAYDRHDHRREFEFGRTFQGTEQLVSAKALFFLQPDQAIRPYVGIGPGVIDSERTSESPTFQPRGAFPVQGQPEIFSYRTRGVMLGLATGFEARVGHRLSVLGELTLDLGSRVALDSTRLTIGAGWSF